MMFYKPLNISYKPTTVYAMLNSICNFGKDEDEQTSLYDLAKVGRTKIFDFDYILSENISKEEFETNILNHFIERRIGFETIASFKLHLRNKIHEIMPKYNKMFDAFEEWNIFNDGEIITKTNTGTDTMNNTGTETLKNTGTDTIANTGTDTITNTGTDTITNTGTETLNNTGTNTMDKRMSDMPQSDLENVQNADYLSDYGFNTETLNTQNQNTLNTQNQRILNTQKQNTLNTQNQRTLNSQNQNTLNTQNQRTLNLTEIIQKIPKEKLKLFREFQENIQNIYTLIYKDLDCLFYQLV